jgi:hypothetical protein
MARRIALSIVMSAALVLLGPTAYRSYATVPPTDAFRMRIVDPRTGDGVPNVRVQSDNGIVCHTRSNGEIAWTEVVLMGREVRFSIDRSDHRNRDVVSVRVDPGGSIELALR